MNDSIASELEPMFSKERRAVIHISLMQVSGLKDRLAAAQLQYGQLLDSASHLKVVPPRMTERLLIRQSYLYRQVLAGNLDTSVLFRFTIPQNIALVRLRNNQLFFKIKFRHISSDPAKEKELYAALRENALYKGAGSIERYNLMTFLIGKWQSDTSYDRDTLTSPHWMLSQLNRIKGGEVNADSLKQLYLNFYFKTAAWCLATGMDDTLRRTCVSRIYNHYAAHRMSDSTALKMARYFIWHGDEKKAYHILKPYALKKDPNHELLVLFLKMSYVHADEDPKNKFYKWMTDAATILTAKEYADMLSGPCNMSFQVLDNEKIRKIYCDKCSNELNFAQQYKIRKRKEKHTKSTD